MVRSLSVLTVFLLLVAGGAADAAFIVTTDWTPPSSPDYIGEVESLDTWWHDGGPPYPGDIPNDDINVFPDKNHDVRSFKETVAPASLVSSYMRKLTAENLNDWVVNGPPVYGATYGHIELGEFQDLSGATDHYFPPETTGTPLYVHGDVPSGLLFKDVKDEMLVQFFSSDKNDGFIEVLVNGVFVDRFDTWVQGWWYLQIKGMDPSMANTVELRTRYDFAGGHGYPSPHINTLDLNPGSENWLHILPTDPANYPIPDDFHVFFVAYNYTAIPEPATMTLVGLGGMALGGRWLRRRRQQA